MKRVYLILTMITILTFTGCTTTKSSHKFIKKAEDLPIDFSIVEKKPEMVGGMRSLYKRVIYPDSALNEGINGKVILEFICSKTGKPTKIKILYENPKGFGFGKASISALEKCNFKPGVHNGKPVSVITRLPIRFVAK
ncbi:MAG: hypothetical protein CR982_09850 [Candidatus Cloacimonadota bacterium]|nr:MAG: hypothetical protein CR982_09850 [Candidatus Cloacimonadota bacterium]PIE78209.1 MAG: hypothetical protein CSA15_09165 [Candidatus Delongbacteria bacterium]